MMIKPKYFIFACLVLLALCQKGFCEPTLTKVNLDKFFRQDLRLQRLVDTPQAVNLMAQMNDPEGLTDDVNNFDQFVAIATFPLPKTIITTFDKNQKISSKFTYYIPWVGVSSYRPSDIPKMSFQEGFKNLKRCMEKRGIVLPEKMARFVVYKTIYNTEYIYDYVIPRESAAGCQEYLYAPVSNVCSIGMPTYCHYEQDFSSHNDKENNVLKH